MPKTYPAALTITERDMIPSEEKFTAAMSQLLSEGPQNFDVTRLMALFCDNDGYTYRTEGSVTIDGDTVTLSYLEPETMGFADIPVTLTYRLPSAGDRPSAVMKRLPFEKGLPISPGASSFTASLDEDTEAVELSVRTHWLKTAERSVSWELEIARCGMLLLRDVMRIDWKITEPSAVTEAESLPVFEIGRVSL